MSVGIGPNDDGYHAYPNGVGKIAVLPELGGGETLMLGAWPIGCSNHLTQQKGVIVWSHYNLPIP